VVELRREPPPPSARTSTRSLPAARYRFLSAGSPVSPQTRSRSKRFSLTFAREVLSRDFGTTTSRDCIVIFLLTSFFINSMFQLVAAKHRCKFSMKNGRENRNNGNQEKGKEEKEALRKFSTK
jgi:hypothetical protein